MRLAFVALLLAVACSAPSSNETDAGSGAPLRVLLRVYDDGEQSLDACSLDFALMDGNAYGRLPVSCADSTAEFDLPRGELPHAIYFLDWQSAPQGPIFDLEGDEGPLVRLAIRVRPLWQGPPPP